MLIAYKPIYMYAYPVRKMFQTEAEVRRKPPNVNVKYWLRKHKLILFVIVTNSYKEWKMNLILHKFMLISTIIVLLEFKNQMNIVIL